MGMKNGYTKGQFAAINANGPVLVSACPGAGKTRSMVGRVLRMIRNGVEPSSIYVITFTKKGAAEFNGRVKAAHENGKNTNTSTIHSLALRVLRETNHNVRIVKDGARYAWARKINPDDPDDVLNRVSKIRCSNIGDDEDKKLATEYVDWLKTNNQTDMDGLILLATPVADRWAKEADMNALIVDEFQDTDFSQWHFIKAIVKHSGADACFVGDRAQSIYGFRGALPQVFNFAAKDLGAKHLYLDICFRCRPHIIKAANLVINGMYSGVRKVTSHLEDSKENVTVVACKSASNQARATIVSIKKMKEKGIQNSKIAVLARTRDELTLTALAMKVANIPLNGESINNPFRSKIRRTILGLVRYMAGSISEDDLAKGIASLNVRIDVKAAIDLIKYRNNFDQFEEAAAKLFRGWARRSALKALEIVRQAYDESWETAERRCIAMKEPAEPDDNGVVLTTAHASKGREWDAVIVIGCDDNNFPHPSAVSEEEERRILFVAMTRAREQLTLLSPSNNLCGFVRTAMSIKDTNAAKATPRKQAQKRQTPAKGRLHKLVANLFG